MSDSKLAGMVISTRMSHTITARFQGSRIPQETTPIRPSASICGMPKAPRLLIRWVGRMGTLPGPSSKHLTDTTVMLVLAAIHGDPAAIPTSSSPI